MNVPLRELHLFAGAGGGILGGILLGHVPVCAVELEEYPRNVLLQRQRDGILPWFPVWDDVRTFDGRPWRGRVDLIAGGFPCQDISAAGKGAGIDGSRSGLWSEFARIIGEVRPHFVFVENSPNLTTRGLGRVLGDLATLGFDAEWCVLGADDAGAPHKRDRIWVLGRNTNRLHAPSRGSQPGIQEGPNSEPLRDGDAAHAGSLGHGNQEGQIPAGGNALEPGGNDLAHAFAGGPGWTDWSGWWSREPEEALRDAGRGRGQEDGMQFLESELGRVADGMAFGVERLHAIGNGQVPQCAAMASRILYRRLIEN